MVRVESFGGGFIELKKQRKVPVWEGLFYFKEVLAVHREESDLFDWERWMPNR